MVLQVHFVQESQYLLENPGRYKKQRVYFTANYLNSIKHKPLRCLYPMPSLVNIYSSKPNIDDYYTTVPYWDKKLSILKKEMYFININYFINNIQA